MNPTDLGLALTEYIDKAVEQSLRKALQSKASSGEAKNQLLNIEQAAELLDLAVQTIYGMTSRNEIPHYKKGKKLYFKESELIQWIEAGRQKTQKELESEARIELARRKRGSR